MLRGPAGIGDAQRNVGRLRGALRLAHWNEEVRASRRRVRAARAARRLAVARARGQAPTGSARLPSAGRRPGMRASEVTVRRIGCSWLGPLSAAPKPHPIAVRQGFKIGLCSQPPVGLPYSLLALSNNCCITDTLAALQRRFAKLYKRRWATRLSAPPACTHGMRCARQRTARGALARAGVPEVTWRRGMPDAAGLWHHAAAPPAAPTTANCWVRINPCARAPAAQAGSAHPLPASLAHPCAVGAPPLAHARRLFLHHYEEYMERAGFDEAAEAIAALHDDYKEADAARPAPVVRMRPRGLAFA